jgi:serine/threonine protein kinase
MSDPMHFAEEMPKSIGPFDVLEEIGHGGSATVYKVRHTPTGKVAALKVFPRFLKLEPGAVERFKRELTVIRPLQHPNIVRAVGQGEQDDMPYLVLEYVPGQNLDARIKEKGALSVEETVAIFRQVTDGLRYLHTNNILHRDIKPSNILLTPTNQAKLGDFGLVKNLNDTMQLTQTRQSMGTIDYGAPEQFEDAKTVDRRCDLYSLAATLYTALTGKFPFGNGGQLQIMQRKALNQYVPLRLLLSSLDPAIDRLVVRGLESNRNNRPSDCEEFIAVLRNCNTRPTESSNPAEFDIPNVRSSLSGDRRATLRFAVDLTANFVPFHQQMRGRWQAQILDVSAGGICLQTPRPVAVNSVLQITLGKRTSSELVLVRWVQPGEGQTHIVGCSFVRPLAGADLEAICRAGSQQSAAG